MVVVSQPGNEPVVATAGMTPEEAERQLVGDPADGGETRAITINYRYAAESVDDETLDPRRHDDPPPGEWTAS